MPEKLSTEKMLKEIFTREFNEFLRNKGSYDDFEVIVEGDDGDLLVNVTVDRMQPEEISTPVRPIEEFHIFQQHLRQMVEQHSLTLTDLILLTANEIAFIAHPLGKSTLVQYSFNKVYDRLADRQSQMQDCKYDVLCDLISTTLNGEE